MKFLFINDGNLGLIPFFFAIGINGFNIQSFEIHNKRKTLVQIEVKYRENIYTFLNE